MTIEQGADERRVAHLLRSAGVGPDGRPDTSAAREPDWLDRLWDAQDADEHQAQQAARIPDWWTPGRPNIGAPAATDGEEDLVPILVTGRTPAPAVEQPEHALTEATDPDEEQPAGPGRFAPAPGYWPRPHWPDIPAPVQRVALSHRTRAGLYSAAAAGAGYGLGLEPTMSGWLADCSAHAGVPAALILGVGGCVVLAHVWDRRTRHWWPGLAWAARIPLASALLALGLYAPGTI
jgi:hypothetical protein